MALAGKNAKVYVSTNGSSYTQVNGLNSVDIEVGYERADIAQFGDSAARTLPTISTFKGSCSGVRDATDSGQNMVVTAQTTPALLYVKVLVDGTNGYACQCSLGAMKIGAKQGNEAVSFSFDFEAGGGAAATVVP